MHKDVVAVLVQGREIPAERILKERLNFGLDISPDCKTLAVAGSDDNQVQMWNLTGPKPRKERVLTGHENWVDALAFSPDGTKLATGSKDKTVRLWDVATGNELAKLAHEGQVWALAFAPDGTLASGGQCDIHLWARALLEREKPQAEEVKGIRSPMALAFAPDSKRLAFGIEHAARFLDLEKRPPYELSPLEKLGRTSMVSFAYSPDGKMLCVGLSGRASLWKLTGKDTREPLPLIVPLPGNPGDCRVAFTPNGKRLVSSFASGHVLVFETDSREKSEKWAVSQGIDSFALAADGRHVALGNKKGKVYILRLSSLPTQ
jgi:WD40 repeat protein